MPKMSKTAEQALTDAGKFPAESCRERLARKYGEDAVALSGPCEGANLADCVCKQLQDRWDRISDRFSGSTEKAIKLAMRLADSLSKKDDTDKCISDLQGLGYQKVAANGIAGYLKAYAMGELMAKDIDHMVDDVNDEPLAGDDGFAPGAGEESIMDEEPGLEGPGGPEGGDEMVDFDLGMDDDLMGEEPGMEPSGDMVSIDIPREVVHELMEALQSQAGDLASEEAHAEDAGVPGDLAGIPGEPADMQDANPGGQVVETSHAAPCPCGQPGCDCADKKEKDACGVAMAGEPAKEESLLDKAKANLDQYIAEEKKPEVGVSHEEHEKHEKKEDKEFGEVEEKVEDAKETDREKDEHMPKEKDEFKAKEASTDKGVKTAQADGKQIGGKELGNAKSKDVEGPKPLPDGNVKPEGFTAGDSKFQDGSTIKNEQKFDAKEVKKDEVSGGQKSIMGPDESLPTGGPKVPAGSSPIHGEEWQGGELMTKGTVIATITPNGIEVKLPDGKRLLAKASINKVTSAMVKAVEAVKFEGDGVKFAKAALRAAKGACTAVVNFAADKVTVSTPFEAIEIKATIKDVSKALADSIAKVEFKGDLKAYAAGVRAVLADAKYIPDNCTHTDTGKLEAEKFTNDAEKKADDAPASTKAPAKKEEETKYEGGKNNPENDAEKKPETDKKASVAGTQKTAGEKKVEDPKPLPDGNVKPEGFTAGDSKFQDGSTIKNEQKFDAKEVKKDEVSGGEKSKMGPDESLPTGGPKVPAGSGHIKNETWEGGDVSTKGTVIATKEEHEKREAAIVNEAKVREARLKVASVYVADLLKNGEITEAEYSEKLEKYAQMQVDALQALIVSTKKARERAMARMEATASATQPAQGPAGISFPVIISSTSAEKTLKDRLVENFKLTRRLDELDGMKPAK